MKALLTEMLAQDVAPTYVRALLAAFPVSPHVALSTEPTPPALLEPLTTRERTILRLLAAGHSSPEIAAELVVAVSTVRTHLKSLYGKLEAHSRHEAISRGRALGLLP
jgi:LuxR family maltose regulon positive regulatory protein